MVLAHCPQHYAETNVDANRTYDSPRIVLTQKLHFYVPRPDDEALYEHGTVAEGSQGFGGCPLEVLLNLLRIQIRFNANSN